MTFRRGTTLGLTACGTRPRALLLLGGHSRTMGPQLPRGPRTKLAQRHSLKQSTMSYHGGNYQGWRPQVLHGTAATARTLDLLQSIHQMPLPLHPRAPVPYHSILTSCYSCETCQL